jgi:glycosyltransferase involved in cell wall biosynthesis
MSSKVVVVHSGARDAYQVASALEEESRLEALVTDLYWPRGRWWTHRIEPLLPFSIVNQLSSRHENALRPASVKQLIGAGLLTLALDKWKRAPKRWRRAATRRTDDRLGSWAGELATTRSAGLLSYSYYGHSAFQHYAGHGAKMLFQLHPHPATMRRILLAERDKHPDCAGSLNQEWELALPERDFTKLVGEVQMADAWLAASSFTKTSLIENGVPGDRIAVVPYGVNLDKYQPKRASRNTNAPLKLLFVGRINQRKGVKYLLEALRKLPAKHIELTICGRVVDDLKIFEAFQSQITIRPSVSHAELVSAYQSADLFVFPSVAEGFGHVLLEAMACGLPVLSTRATAAADIVSDGIEGFVVEPGCAQPLVERVEWALAHRHALVEMRDAARSRAEQYTWARFRQGVNEFVSQHCRETSSTPLHAELEAAL